MMNDRIDVLALEATDAKGGLDRHKFAELIVRECFTICDQQSRASWNDDRKMQARLDRDLIKEHFGVE